MFSCGTCRQVAVADVRDAGHRQQRCLRAAGDLIDGVQVRAADLTLMPPAPPPPPPGSGLDTPPLNVAPAIWRDWAAQDVDQVEHRALALALVDGLHLHVDAAGAAAVKPPAARDRDRGEVVLHLGHLLRRSPRAAARPGWSRPATCPAAAAGSPEVVVVLGRRVLGAEHAQRDHRATRRDHQRRRRAAPASARAP